MIALAAALTSLLPGPLACAADSSPASTPMPSASGLLPFVPTALIWLMPAGLAMLAAGLTRAKNASHTAFMTFFGCAIAIIGFWIGGFAVVHGGSGFFLNRLAASPSDMASFFWQASTLCVAASIPVGALAERWSLRNFYVSVLFFSLITFPFFAWWTWGGGWLSRLGFVDSAGSGVVHATGGLLALAGALILGPRIGRYTRDGNLIPIPAHNVPLSLLGSFLLVVGWLGFNVARAPESAASIAVVTILAAAGGGIAAATFMIMTTRKPDPTITINGLLAGLVASSAGAPFISPTAAVIISVVAGLLACLAVQFLDKRRVDDPVGAISVHGVGGLWGVLAVGIFASQGSVTGCLHGGWSQLGAQLLGAAVLLVWAGGVSWIFLKTLDWFIPMRVPPEVELEGLDIPETGLISYPDFQIISSHTTGFSTPMPRLSSRREYDHEKN
ncbi:MAG TPA: ammonium transporter [Verrucomicrobiae bacterium]|nr:ammonium transporter [Verrucomicrobiae bacterium]